MMLRSITDRKSLFVCGMTFLLCLLWSPLLTAEEMGFNDNPYAKKYALVLIGASSDDEGENQKRTWANKLRASLQQDYGYESSDINVLLGADKKTQIGSDGECSAENIRTVLKRYQKDIEAGDQLTVFIFGHSSGEGDLAKLHIVGPDLTAKQFAELFSPIKTNNIVVINTTGASYEFTKPLAKPGRILISATRTRAEKYDTVFPHYLIEGLESLAADRDKNQRLSFLEAFNYTTTKVNEYYREKESLPSEHATLDDNGDGVFSLTPGTQADGRLAEIAFLNKIAFSQAELSPKARELRATMSQLERDIFLMRSAKSSLPEKEYWQQLEPLIIDLAKATRDYNALIQ